MPQGIFEFHDLPGSVPPAGLRQYFYHSLSAPLDGMWDDIIHRSRLFSISYRQAIIGYGALDTNSTLIHFYIRDTFLNRSAEVLSALISARNISHAYVPTLNPSFLNAALLASDKHGTFYYFFDDHERVESHLRPLPPFDDLTLQAASSNNLNELVRFCHKLSGADRQWLTNYMSHWLAEEGIYYLRKRGRIIATMELRPSATQRPYADIGAIVDEDCRGKGVGAFLMQEGKRLSYARDLLPICSCRHDNPASRRMIEKAGYVNRHLMLKIKFSPANHQSRR